MNNHISGNGFSQASGASSSNQAANRAADDAQHQTPNQARGAQQPTGPIARNAAGLALAMPHVYHTPILNAPFVPAPHADLPPLGLAALRQPQPINMAQQARIANRQARFEVNMARAAAGLPLVPPGGQLNAVLAGPANVVNLHNELPAPPDPENPFLDDGAPLGELLPYLRDLLDEPGQALSPPPAPRTPSPTQPEPAAQRRRMS